MTQKRSQSKEMPGFTTEDFLEMFFPNDAHEDNSDDFGGLG